MLSECSWKSCWPVFIYCPRSFLGGLRQITITYQLGFPVLVPRYDHWGYRIQNNTTVHPISVTHWGSSVTVVTTPLGIRTLFPGRDTQFPGLYIVHTSPRAAPVYGTDHTCSQCQGQECVDVYLLSCTLDFFTSLCFADLAVLFCLWTVATPCTTVACRD